MEKFQGRSATPCNEIQQYLPAFLRHTLYAEQRGRIQGHLLSCRICAQACGKMLDVSLRPTPEPSSTPLPMPRLPDTVLAAMRIRHPSQGSVWTHLQALQAANAPWAMEEMHRLLRALQSALLLWAAVRVSTRRVRARGAIHARRQESIRGAEEGEAAWPASLQIEMTDTTGQPSGHRMSLHVVQPPIVTRDGHFVTILSTNATALEHQELLCTVTIAEEARVTFTGELLRHNSMTGYQVIIHAEGLPTGEQDVVIPKEQVLWSLRKRVVHAD